MRAPILALLLGVLAILLFAWSCASVRAADCEMMVASWYGAESGNRTADGSYFDGSQMIAAHRTLPFGTKLRVIYGGRSVVVTVRDRGPFVRSRSLDLSRAAAQRLNFINTGVGRVCVEGL